MKTFDKWVIEVMYVLIPGFIYILALSVFIYTITSDKALSFYIAFKDYTVIIIIVLLLISYIIGFTMDLFLQWCIWRKWPKYKSNFEKMTNIQFNNGHKEYNEYYIGLLMVRQLIVSIFLLIIGLAFYIKKFKQFDTELYIEMSCIVFILILSFAYNQLKIKVNIINKLKEKFYNKQS